MALSRSSALETEQFVQIMFNFLDEFFLEYTYAYFIQYIYLYFIHIFSIIPHNHHQPCVKRCYIYSENDPCCKHFFPVRSFRFRSSSSCRLYFSPRSPRLSPFTYTSFNEPYGDYTYRSLVALCKRGFQNFNS